MGSIAKNIVGFCIYLVFLLPSFLIRFKTILQLSRMDQRRKMLCFYLFNTVKRQHFIGVFVGNKMDQRWKSLQSSDLSFIIFAAISNPFQQFSQVNDAKVLDSKKYIEIFSFLWPKQSVLPANIPFDMWIWDPSFFHSLNQKWYQADSNDDVITAFHWFNRDSKNGQKIVELSDTEADKEPLFDALNWNLSSYLKQFFDIQTFHQDQHLLRVKRECFEGQTDGNIKYRNIEYLQSK